jgi:hypothetical protein
VASTSINRHRWNGAIKKAILVNQIGEESRRKKSTKSIVELEVSTGIDRAMDTLTQRFHEGLEMVNSAEHPEDDVASILFRTDRDASEEVETAPPRNGSDDGDSASSEEDENSFAPKAPLERLSSSLRRLSLVKANHGERERLRQMSVALRGERQKIALQQRLLLKGTGKKSVIVSEMDDDGEQIPTVSITTVIRRSSVRRSSVIARREASLNFKFEKAKIMKSSLDASQKRKESALFRQEASHDCLQQRLLAKKSKMNEYGALKLKHLSLAIAGDHGRSSSDSGATAAARRMSRRASRRASTAMVLGIDPDTSTPAEMKDIKEAMGGEEGSASDYESGSELSLHLSDKGNEVPDPGYADDGSTATSSSSSSSDGDNEGPAVGGDRAVIRAARPALGLVIGRQMSVRGAAAMSQVDDLLGGDDDDDDGGWFKMSDLEEDVDDSDCSDGDSDAGAKADAMGTSTKSNVVGPRDSQMQHLHLQVKPPLTPRSTTAHGHELEEGDEEERVTTYAASPAPLSGCASGGRAIFFPVFDQDVHAEEGDAEFKDMGVGCGSGSGSGSAARRQSAELSVEMAVAVPSSATTRAPKARAKKGDALRALSKALASPPPLLSEEGSGQVSGSGTTVEVPTTENQSIMASSQMVLASSKRSGAAMKALNRALSGRMRESGSQDSTTGATPGDGDVESAYEAEESRRRLQAVVETGAVAMPTAPTAAPKPKRNSNGDTQEEKNKRAKNRTKALRSKLFEGLNKNN